MATKLFVGNLSFNTTEGDILDLFKQAGNVSSCELIDIARHAGLEKVEAEFLGEQKAARRVFEENGFNQFLYLQDYVKDMQAIAHDYVLMGRDLLTDEEYAGAQ